MCHLVQLICVVTLETVSDSKTEINTRQKGTKVQPVIYGWLRRQQIPAHRCGGSRQCDWRFELPFQSHRHHLLQPGKTCDPMITCDNSKYKHPHSGTMTNCLIVCHQDYTTIRLCSIVLTESLLIQPFAPSAQTIDPHYPLTHIYLQTNILSAQTTTGLDSTPLP